MSNKNKVHGIATITIGGRRLETKAGAKLNLGGVTRSAVEADGGIAGYAEKVVAATLECAIVLKDDIRLKDFQAMTNETILFKSDIGREWILSSAFLTNSPELGEEVSLSFASSNEAIEV